jgi:hypothetical protein
MTSSKTRYFIPSVADMIFLSVFLYLSLSGGMALLKDCDTGYHIRAGEFILNNHAIPRQDMFSFISPPLPWTAHEWLSELIMALVYRVSGLTGIVVFYSFFIALVYSLLYKTLRAGRGNIFLAIAITLLVTVSSQLHWLARPHVFSLLLMVVWYYLLEAYQYRDRNRLFLLPILMLLWVNLHGGYIAGFVILGIFLLDNVIKTMTIAGAEKALHLDKAKALALTASLCIVAALINPFGYHILLFPFNVVSNKYLMDHVNEFLSPNFHESLPFKYLFLYTIMVIAVSRKRLNFIEIALILFFTNMALFAVRYVTLFALISAPIILRKSDSILDESSSGIFDFLKRRGTGIASVDDSSRGYIWPIAGILAVVIIGMSGRLEYKFDAKIKPVAAVEFLKKERIPGHMFNNDEFGDYIIYAAWPQYKVFFDGRSDMYGVDQMKDYYEVAGFDTGWEKILDKYGISWIIYYANSSLSRFLLKDERWRLIYSDKVANIFVKNVPAFSSLINKYKDVKPVVDFSTEKVGEKASKS